MKFNIDLHWDYATAVTVEADSLQEALAKLEKHIEDGKFDHADLEPTSDYELDASWQPENPEDIPGRIVIP